MMEFIGAYCFKKELTEFYRIGVEMLMKYTITDLEIETIYHRIQDNDIDLQPDFQRGEVWSDKKKKKLIDTILRGWQIPPIHLVETHKFVDEVLDGQQRLATIRDFMNGKIRIDGDITPFDEWIYSLDGLTYDRLDSNTQRKFRKFSIRMIRLTEYEPEEPAELFYRLNQPATLTSAEQRNAFIGETRNQIKELVYLFEIKGASKETIGFSNSRMAYDDIVSKFCYILEAGTLKRKVTSNDISEKFRQGIAFSDQNISTVKRVLDTFMEGISVRKTTYGERVALNKATLFSWLLFVYRNLGQMPSDYFGYLVYLFEYIRTIIKGKEINIDPEFQTEFDKLQRNYPFFQSMILLFNQKASMGSTDATSIIIRDIILEMFSEMVLKREERVLNNLVYNEQTSLLQSIERIADSLEWGGDIK